MHLELYPYILNIEVITIEILEKLDLSKPPVANRSAIRLCKYIAM